MAIDFTKIELRKQNVIDLKKQSGLDVSYKAQVVLALDFSGSMGSMYKDGTVQDVVERLLPFGLAFDDNGEVDFYLFHDSYIKMPDNITVKNLDGYINNKVLGKYSMGGTNYAPVLRKIQKDFSAGRSGGFMGMGSKSNKMGMPVYVIYITDGENSDHQETESIVRDMSKEGFFIQFVGIGNQRFNFLEKLDNLSGRLIDNANFFKLSNIRNESDANLYEALMKEFPSWTHAAKAKGLI